jgi:hypothetical protein
MDEPSHEERKGAGCVGLPAMIGLLVIVAVVPNVYGVGGLITAVIAVLVLFLVIGLTMTLANKQ